MQPREAEESPKTPQQERRFKLALVSPEEIASFLTCDPLEIDPGGTWNWVTRRLAGDLEGASLVGVNFDPHEQAFVFSLASASFPVVPLGERAPIVLMTYEIVKLAVHRPAKDTPLATA